MPGVGSGDVPSGSLVARRGLLSGSGQERGPRPPRRGEAPGNYCPPSGPVRGRHKRLSFRPAPFRRLTCTDTATRPASGGPQGVGGLDAPGPAGGQGPAQGAHHDAPDHSQGHQDRVQDGLPVPDDRDGEDDHDRGVGA